MRDTSYNADYTPALHNTTGPFYTSYDYDYNGASGFNYDYMDGSGTVQHTSYSGALYSTGCDYVPMAVLALSAFLVGRLTATTSAAPAKGAAEAAEAAPVPAPAAPLPAPTAPPPLPQQGELPALVHVSAHGERYHRKATCPGLNSATSAVTTRTPCGICWPTIA